MGLANVCESEEEEIVFYQRFFYSAKMKKFQLAAVPLFCLCAMPQNPDHLMIQCDICKDWFHPKCVGMTDKEASALKDGYVCPRHHSNRFNKWDIVCPKAKVES